MGVEGVVRWDRKAGNSGEICEVGNGADGMTWKDETEEEGCGGIAGAAGSRKSVSREPAGDGTGGGWIDCFSFT